MAREATIEPIAKRSARRVERTPAISSHSASIPSLLEGLARIHPRLVVCDEDGRIVWLSRALEATGADGVDWHGAPWLELRAQLDIGSADASAAAEQGSPEAGADASTVARTPDDDVLGASSLSTSGGSTGTEPDPSHTPRHFEIHEPSGRRLTVHIVDEANGPPGTGDADEADGDPRDAPQPTRNALERQNEELENVVRSVAHDLRSPLVSILGFARLLREDEQNTLDATGLHFIDRIEEAGRNIERLLADLLELHRIGGTTPTPHARVAPLPVLHQVAAELKLRLDGKGIQLGLPERAPTLHCDRTRLYQIFSNLIGNAIHHMGETSDPRIDVSIEPTDRGWHIEVADNGRGIPAEDHEKIFDAFHRAGAGSHARSGSGLGLPIVKKIVEAHRGRIEVESPPGEGTRFRIWLPRV